MQLDFSRREFADKCKVSAATLQAWEDGRYHIPQKSIIKYVNTLFDCGLITTPEWFMSGEGLPPRPMNKLSISSALTTEQDAILKEINFFETENKNAIITTITDDSMLPFFEIGDYVGGKLISMVYAAKYIGSFCIATLATGETYVRKLRQGTTEHCFNLISTNINTSVPSAFLINCTIVSLAQVIWHRKIGIALE